VIVTILGAGMMGTGMAMPLADRGHAVRLVGTHLDGALVKALEQTRRHPRLGTEIHRGVTPLPFDDAAEALAGADAVVLGVSSAGIDWAGAVLARHLVRPVPIAMVTKGLEAHAGSLRILPDVLADALPAAVRTVPVTVGGPCIAGELARSRRSAVVFAGRDVEPARFFAEAARGPYYRVEVSDDVVGVCVCAALKNAYATAVGVGTGLHERAGGAPGPVAMHNLEAALFGAAVSEIDILSRSLGGRSETVAGLAGAGDLFVTCQGGRSTRLGRLLGLGRTVDQARVEMASAEGPVTLESVDVARTVVQVLRLRAGPPAPERMPLLCRLHDLLFEGAPPESLFDA
jgi:glycerol-3-phosphate dehydrogenase (NAD(P)+)